MDDVLRLLSSNVCIKICKIYIHNQLQGDKKNIYINYTIFTIWKSMNMNDFYDR